MTLAHSIYFFGLWSLQKIWVYGFLIVEDYLKMWGFNICHTHLTITGYELWISINFLNTPNACNKIYRYCFLNIVLPILSYRNTNTV